MAEINNIPNYGINIGKVDAKLNKEVPVEPKVEEKQEKNYVPDTGVIGRSQVNHTKGGNIAKSVDAAVELAKSNPTLLSASEGLFDAMYNDFLAQGMEESAAYMKALMAEEEFLEMGIAYNR